MNIFHMDSRSTGLHPEGFYSSAHMRHEAMWKSNKGEAAA